MKLLTVQLSSILLLLHPSLVQIFTSEPVLKYPQSVLYVI
jgi:hypothetical protein